MEETKLSWGKRVAYGCGDTACNVVFGMVTTLLTLFYTDYVGIDAVTVGLVMLVSRGFDGISDVVMGLIVERTKSRWGKARPWLLWMSVPFAASAVLLFTVPHTTATLQFLYMFVTYNFCTTICYTAINLPYGSLSVMMTRVSSERDLLSIVRMSMSPFGRILAVACTLPLVKLFGDDQAAWVKTMSIWAVIALILLLVCFYFCKETVEIAARRDNKDNTPVKIALKALVTNQYFWAALILWSMQSVAFTVTGTILPYYCKYVFGNDGLYSMIFFTETILLIAATFCSVFLLKMGKRNMCLAGAVLALAGHLLVFVDPHSFELVMATCVIRAIGLAPLNAVVFSFIGDAVEFGQWKTHVRQESLIFAGGSVGTKIGAGAASALMTGFLSLAGYVSSTGGGAVQPESAVQMIIRVYEFGPMIMWAIVITTLALYQLDKKYPAIMRELIEREAKGEL
ncbi:MAG: glycoside-pentoside-hexuronide (GPH):cation symporter [Zoogloeaceae bacterium]|jgi:GPH family glycoside/pentoside/hexuronide:cation symporter|nr:glycoside-pentoside-hexuronide (GPH):cation symporter [Zoogloeaceae bacterium]